jgi:hypothetical protein
VRTLALLSVLAGAAALAGTAPTKEKALVVRLVPIREALKKYPDGTDPRAGALARKAGVDLDRPPHPLLGWSYREKRLFYIFYDVVDGAPADQEFLMQRVRRQERSWKSARDRKPELQESFLVEAFRLRGGSFVGSDRHHGSFGLGSHHKREIRKEFEIGIGQLDGVAQGKAWPFDKTKRYHKVQEYGGQRGAFDRVKFTRSVKWTLVVTFDRDGKYAVRCPELGIDAPRKLPKP